MSFLSTIKMLLRKCTHCDKYTLKSTCPTCNKFTESAHPARFSPDDK
ncbi:H/ACA ribonucleoprotein complex, subunit Nop10, partial [Kipferlia bialata]|eukprot:g12168.t1